MLSTRHWHAKAAAHHIIDGNRHTLVANKERVSAGQEIDLFIGKKSSWKPG